MKIKRYWKEEQGSVILEFCLVLPIYLLLFGGTFLTFDITMGRLHLQEANRNLAWLQNDRYDTDSEEKINHKLYKSAISYFESRNRLESTISDEPMWWYENSDAARDIAGKNKGNSRPKWAHRLSRFKDSDSGMKINDSEFLEMYSGNMPLKMSHVSGVYKGAIGVSSVLFPNRNAPNLYNQAYTFTRAQTTVNNEMLLLRRKGDPNIEGEITLFGGYEKVMNAIWCNWPVGDSIAADVQFLFRMQL